MTRTLLALSLALFLAAPAVAEHHQHEPKADAAEPAMPTPPLSSTETYTVWGTEAMPEAPAPVNIAAALKEPADLLGKPARFEGRIGKVCQTKGCWMTLTDGDASARVFFGKHDFFLPKDTAGEAIVYGKLEAKTVEEKMAKHLAEDAGQDPAQVSGEQKEWRIVASSVLVKK
ncbi:MAG: DUF4920 domain-containing protein [Xanthomonadales bacterium]|jgi:hypothetical protein|nr:DUF4920 domain-containing protein [Xanthomonadales bacterium]